MAVTQVAIVYRDPNTLKGYARNARTHSDEQVEQIMCSIEEFGFTNPILLKDDDTTIGAGHGRQLAAIRLGLASVPTITLHGLTEAQWRAYVLADNKIALNAGWDMQLLAGEIRELRDLGLDMTIAGFQMTELASLETIFDSAGSEPDPEKTPPVPTDPISRAGDLWDLGPHRLACGDCTNAHDVERALDGAAPPLMVTDPPYGVDYDPNWRNSAERGTALKSWTGKTGRKIGATAVGAVDNDTQADWREAWALFAGDVAYVWHAGLHADVVAASLKSVGFEIRSQIIWNKATLIIGRGDYHWKHEPCWYAVRKGRPGRFNRKGEDGRTQSTIWDITHRSSETGHSTQKPVEAMRRPIDNNSVAGEAIYEPFSGSGTTLIACQIAGRIFHGLEINPGYVDVAVLRWQAHTGQDATLRGDGRTFAAIAAAGRDTGPGEAPSATKAAAKKR